MSTALPMPTAAHVMQRDVVSFHPDQQVAEALQMLLARRISGGPVVAGGRVVGMFSERDGLSVLAASAYEAEPTGTLGQHMRTSFRTIGPDTDLFRLADIFKDNPVRRLPVVDNDGQLLGIVLRGDVIQALQRFVDQRTPVLREARTPYERVAEHLA